jgi:hypothetical protein
MPVEGVIPGLRAIVEEVPARLPHHLLQAGILEKGSLEQPIGPFHIALMVLVVVEAQSFGGDVGGERVGVKRENGKMKGHGFLLSKMLARREWKPWPQSAAQPGA